MNNQCHEESVRRFIAGAVCPRCQAVDKIRVFSRGEVLWQDCVNCGFEATLECEESSGEDLEDGASFATGENGLIGSDRN
jgi:uncharacterized metal-binding protein (TIGR02443 family)